MTPPGVPTRSGAALDESLAAIAAAARDYARGRDRGTVRGALQRVLDEAALTLDRETRGRVDAALGTTPGTGEPAVLAWIALLAEARRLIEDDVVERVARVRAALLRAGTLLDAGPLVRSLEIVGEDPAAAPDLGALLDRRRALSLVEADLDKREGSLKHRWQQARPQYASLAGDPAAAAAQTALDAGDILPVARALDDVEAWPRFTSDAGAAPGPEADALSAPRQAAEAAVEAAAAALSPSERAAIEALLLQSRGAEGKAAVAAWRGALQALGAALADLSAARGAMTARLSKWLGLDPDGRAAASAGPDLLYESFEQRRAAAEGGLAAARADCLEAEWGLSRALWEDGGGASVAALLAARRAFLDCHVARSLPAASEVKTIAARAAEAEARVRLEASWRRRALLRHRAAAADDRGREIGRLAWRLGPDAARLSDADLEQRCRQTEAALRAALAHLCGALPATTGTGGAAGASAASGASADLLLTIDPAGLESALRRTAARETRA